ncbi:VWA domain-containing protein [Hahella sp. SMD15-11]|uniref:VWA domain-containing protein n=1 Tax=Thermohahella caldifontis TaxID=3142973 RepID=A0AB39UY56_9GAMM
MRLFQRGSKGAVALSLWLIAAFWGTLAQAAIQLPENPDVRVIVDISGSMKKNDPQNLRRPAVRLIANLLPPGSTAGVWTFGQYVNMLVKHRPVDDAWKAEVIKASEQINSVALFTNIGAALEKAADDFSDGAKHANTHFILLSDGVVDISKNTEENVAERRRILSQVLPGIQAAGATIHTIALSDNADKSLLETIAVRTGGVAVVAKSAEELTRVFVETLEQAVPAEEVPIKDNQFDVDSNVQELTALLFRAKDAPPTELIDPSGKSITADDHGDDVRWLREADFDLITITKPFEGSWKLKATPAPGSRVTVVSNLRMVMGRLPANFYAGDRLDIEVGFFEDGQQVTEPNFLRLIDLDITVEFEDGKSGTKRISDPANPPADGVFRDAITKLKTTGRYKVIATADGKTFRRQARQLITLQPPFAVELEATGSGETTRYLLTATPRNPHIDIAGTSIVAKIKAPDASTLIKTMPFVDDVRRWELPIEATKGEGEYTVQLTVKAKLDNGATFGLSPKEVVAEFPRQEASPNRIESLVDPEQVNAINAQLTEEPVVQKAPEPEPAAEAEPAVIAPISEEAIAQAEAEQTAAAEQTPEEASGIPLWVMIAIGGGVLLILGGAGFWFWRRKKQAQLQARPRKKPGQGKRPSLRDDAEDAGAAATAAAAAGAAAAEAAEPDLEDEIERLEEPEAIDMDEFDTPETGAAEPEVTELDDHLAAEDVTDVPDTDVMDDADAMEFDINAADEIDAAFEAAAEPEEVNVPEPAESEPPVVEAVPEADEVAAGGEDELDPEALADQILQENEQARKRIEDDEFNLEDFDIADVDDLPDEDEKKPDA